MPSEFELIAQIRERLSERSRNVLLASGDDASVVRCEGVTVTSVDAFVEGVHFRLATTSLRDLGHKCLAAAVSDLAAMGARAGEAYFAVGLPDGGDAHDMLELTDGAEALAADLGVTICGGDLVRAAELFISVTAVGHAQTESLLVLRSGARAGDLLGVTGELGGARAGLTLLERKLGGFDASVGDRLLERHLRPRPQLAAGCALAGAGVSAMIDVSDGIASDAQRLSEASGVAIDVELEKLPIQEGVGNVAAATGAAAQEFAAIGGEDYELLVACPPDAQSNAGAAAQAAGETITWIGTIREGTGVRLLNADRVELDLAGWDHLR